jgi:hypothetical protein
MRNILILCDSFQPAFAPRMGYVCKYLREFGYNPIIVSEYLPQNIYSELSEKQDVTYVNYYFSSNKMLQNINYAFVFLTDLFFDYKNFSIRKKAEKLIREKKIDIILTSSYRVFPIVAACQLSKRYKIPLVVDLRDIFEQSTNNELISKKITNISFVNNFIAKNITKKLMKQRNKVLKNADVVTTVSDFHVETLSKYNQNVKLIYNGFDSDLFLPQTIENEKFTITFAGRLHNAELRNPTLLFEAVARLSEEKKIDAKTFRLQFYLMDEVSKKIIFSLAEKYKILDFLDIFDAVANVEIPKILNESSILLLLANKSTGENTPKGIMGTKVFEYLAVEKPILCVRNDEGCLQEIIKWANAGLSASTAENCEKFILEKYEEWQQNGYTHQPVNRDFVRQFSRKGQAAQFVELFEKAHR